MKYNPRKPWDIFNFGPQSMWPFKKGEVVIGIARGGIIRGRVTWYHPAREIDHSCVISPGHPFVRVQYHKEHTETVTLAECRRDTPKGRRELEAIFLQQYWQRVAHYKKELKNAQEFFDSERRIWERKWKKNFYVA